MKIAVFSYDEEFLNRFIRDMNIFFVLPLNLQTAALTKGFEAICVFINENLYLSNRFQRGMLVEIRVGETFRDQEFAKL